MHKTVIADTTCLIVLSDIDALPILHELYGEIVTTPAIADEYGEPLPLWIEVRSAEDAQMQTMLSLQVDGGEASAIALALETPGSLLIIDDLKARRLAGTLHLNFTGTLGVLIRAKKEGVIENIRPLLERIRKTHFHITEELLDMALEEAGE